MALYAVNIHEISSSVIWRSLLISLVATFILLIVLQLVIHNWLKAALITSLITLFFFSYGRLYDYLKTTPLASINIVRHRYLAALFAILLGLLCWLIWKYMRDYKPITGLLNIIAIIMVVFPAYQVAQYSINTASGQRAISTWTPSTSMISASQPKDKPDVYYIILDSYTRADMLEIELGFNNSDFIQQLEGLGFYVADCSRSNYNITYISLTSSLNMTYLPELYAESDKLGISRADVWKLLAPSVVRHIFESFGYKIVTFDTGYKWTTVDDSDLFLERGRDAFGVQFTTPFEQMLMESSALLIYTDARRIINRNRFYSSDNSSANYTGQQEFILDQLPKISEIADPTFTFVHINIPHRPYIFSTNGYLYDPSLISNTDPDHVKFPIGYLYAIEFINDQMLSIIQQILDNSNTPPIIIIQGDHAYGNQYYYFHPILNAYYLPGIQTDPLYPMISPVNTFRVVFNEYFNGHYDLLPDFSYHWADYTNPLPEVYPDCQK
jgi:hypothetical protein